MPRTEEAPGGTANGAMMVVRSLFLPARLIALMGSIGGVLAFRALGLPLPFLLGPMFACLALALLGLKLDGYRPISSAMRTVLGVAVGASITPALMERLPEMAYSVALVPALVLLIGLAGYPWFRRVCGFDHATSWYAAMPGGLQDMLIFGIEAGGSARTLSLVHATRVLLIVASAPFLIDWLWDRPLDAAPGVPATAIPADELLLMAVAAAVGWWGAHRIRLFGAAILGPLIAAAALSLAGLIQHRPPAEAILAAQFFIGMGVGVHYVGVTAAELRRDVLSAIGYCVLIGLISLGFAEVVIHAGWAPPLDAALAFAPGGQGEMTVLALVAGADLAFVVTHHLVRLVVVLLGAPLAARLWTR